MRWKKIVIEANILYSLQNGNNIPDCLWIQKPEWESYWQLVIIMLIDKSEKKSE